LRVVRPSTYINESRKTLNYLLRESQDSQFYINQQLETSQGLTVANNNQTNIYLSKYKSHTTYNNNFTLIESSIST